MGHYSLIREKSPFLLSLIEILKHWKITCLKVETCCLIKYIGRLSTYEKSYLAISSLKFKTVLNYAKIASEEPFILFLIIPTAGKCLECLGNF